MLWYVPLEYLDKRYTVLMDQQLKRGFSEFGMDYVEVEGTQLTSGKIETGAFLDSDGTNYFKFSQLQKICELFRTGKIKDGDVFFVSDLWFPGLICIPYMSMFHEIKTKICGIMHAGSWTDTDYVRRLEDWARDVETGWFRMVDGVFVGSKFHKEDILAKEVCTQPEKIHVTGLPFSTSDILTEKRIRLMQKKRDIVILAGRLDGEKRPWIFDEISTKFPQVEFVKTMERDLSKDQYFDLLAKSKIIFSAALQENYGYSLLEAVTLGCTPVVPNDLAYVEMYPKCFRYESFEEAVGLVDKYLKQSVDVSFIAKYYDRSVDRILQHVAELLGESK